MKRLPKYKLLTEQELKELEKEFVDFLVINGIVVDDWLKIKEQSTEKTEEIILLFSDVVYEQVLRSTQYIKSVTPKRILCFHCLESKMVLMGLDARNAEGIDFSRIHYLEEILRDFPPSLSVLHSNKEYQDSRERDIFKMLERGAEISDGNLFKSISLLYAQINEPL